MHWFENRIPPPLVATVFAILMGLYAQPDLQSYGSWRAWPAAAIAVLGLGVCLAGVLSFRLARTTVNPLRPENASSLVVAGIYHRTRNPMYLGFALVLLAWSVLLGAPLTLLGVGGFVLYMNRFQIRPEEQALARLFGDDFSRYCSRTRRWF